MKIPFHTVSGFLGSGKTTFLKRFIKVYSDKVKLGVIQNEFAPSNIDGAELKSTGSDFSLLEINKGSVFCVCLMGDFTRSLEKFIDEHQPDVLILETSGLSDTTAISEVISAGSLAEKIFPATNWCIADALNFKKTGMMQQRVNHQIRMADVVLINKTDLAGSESEKVAEEIRKMNPFAEIKLTVFCDAEFETGQISIQKIYPEQANPLDRPDINAMVIKSGRKLSRVNMNEFLKEWAPKTYRIKGYINLKDGETVAVQCVFGKIEIRETKPGFHPTELVALSDKFSLRDWNHSFKNYC
jgi:G3E family GTPase